LLELIKLSNMEAARLSVPPLTRDAAFVKLPTYSKPKLARHQSFERWMRWRDLCRYRIPLLVLLLSTVAGVIAEVTHSASLTRLALTPTKVQDITDWYDVLRDMFSSPLPTSHEIDTLHPGLPVALATSLLILGLLKIRFINDKVCALIFPDPPSFANSTLETSTGDDLLWSERDKPFAGRKKELDALATFADASHKSSIWSLHGQSGVGKSHLAAIWLKKLYIQGWDIGFLERNTTIGEVEKWRPRAAAGFVLDDASKNGVPWDVLAAIFRKAATAKHRVRLLILSETPARITDSEEDRINRALTEVWFKGIEGNRDPSYALEPVSIAFVHALRKEYGLSELSQAKAERIIRDTEGVTLYTAIKVRSPQKDPRKIIVQRASRALERAGDSVQQLLAMSVLAGPVKLARDSRWTEPDEEMRAKLFPWTLHPAPDRTKRRLLNFTFSNEFEIPQYVPKIEGMELLLAFLGGMIRSNGTGSIDLGGAVSFLEEAIQVGGKVVLDRMLSLLQHHPLVTYAWTKLCDPLASSPQEEYTEAAREARTNAIYAVDSVLSRHRRPEIIASLQAFNAFAFAWVIDELDVARNALECAWQEYRGWARLGIGDYEIAIEATKSAANAADCWGRLAAAEMDEIQRERATEKLDEVLGYLRAFSDSCSNPDIALEAATGYAKIANSWRRLCPSRSDEVLQDRSKAQSDQALRVRATTKLDETFTYLRKLTDLHFPDVEPIAVQVAVGAADRAYGWSQMCEIGADPVRCERSIAKLNEGLVYLWELADRRFPEAEAIANCVADGAINVTGWLADLLNTEIGRPVRDQAAATLREALNYMHELADRRLRGEAIAINAAAVARNVTCGFARVAKMEVDQGRRDQATTCMDETLIYLRELADGRFLDVEAIAIDAVTGAQNAAYGWSHVAKMEVNPARRDRATAKLDGVFAYLRELSDQRFPKVEEIAICAADGINSIAFGWENVARRESKLLHHATAHLDRVLAYLHELADRRFPNVAKIAINMADGTVSATSLCREVARMDADPGRRDRAKGKLAEALAYMHGLADERFLSVEKVSIAAAKCAANGIDIYTILTDDAGRLACRDWLRDLRRRFPANPEIASLAMEYNV
jgi:tetratricopeptide (TPR) repeat protein